MKIYVVGIGPGSQEELTPKAKMAIEQSDAIVGYAFYVDQVKDLCTGKEIFSSTMKQEVLRCKKALELALENKTVAVLSSGDAGVYGMACLMLEVCQDHSDIKIEIIAGITAALSSAAVLGAPLSHDFAVISLSDLLTPWGKIEKRISAAAEADFVIAIYNPRSKKRQNQLNRAVELMLEHKSADCPCGYVKNAGRDGEYSFLCSLSSLPDQEIDMFTTIIVGNSQTKIVNKRLLTPRGYKNI